MEDNTFISWLYKLIRTNNTHAFYVSTRWKHKREDILRRDNNECQMCKAEGGHSEATTVHHIKHLKDNPELALEDSNLMSLCAECHNKVHPEKQKFKKKKPQLNEERW